MINKYLLIATIFCIPFLSGNGFSKSGPIYDMSNQLMGYFDENGNVSIHQFPIISIKDGGVVYNTSNMPIGRVDEGGSVTGRGGMSLGSIGAGGVVYDVSNTDIGQVDEEGYVISHQRAIAQVPDSRIGVLMLLGVIKLQ